ncbi:YbaB/EbfC family DNA-binding protein [Mycolicibacterium thermoresistibile]
MTAGRPVSGLPHLIGEARRFDAAMSRARARLTILDDALDELGAVRGRAASPCGHAAAEVDHTGCLIGLTLTPAAARLDPGRVGDLIVETSTAAVQDLHRRRCRSVRELIAQLGVN